MKRLKILSLLAALIAVAGIAACKKESHYGHGKNLMSQSELIAIYERDGYDEVIIVNKDGEELAHYVLTDSSDSTLYDIPDDAIEIKVPVERLVTDSEVYASAMEELETAELLSGVFNGNYITSRTLSERLKTGEIRDLGQTSSPDSERLLELQPDVILLSYYDGMEIADIAKSGLPVIKMFDLQEETPLGRAEWLRFIGLLTGSEEKADSIFEEVTRAYTEIKRQQTATGSAPKVLTETMYEGVWYVPGGNSYQATLIKDAGGNYFMANHNSAVTLALTPEQVLSKGGDADVWIIKTYGDGKSLHDMLGSDPVYRDVMPFKTGNIYYSDTSRSGLFRDFPFHPERLLEDYRIIFSGDTTATLKYFRKINQ